jgi:RND family efflux transporter MFP subunit
MKKRIGRIFCCVAVLTTSVFCQAEESHFVTGLTEPVFDVTLSLAVPGIISLQRFKEGDLVRSNAVILELDKRLEELEVERRKLIMANRKTDWESTKMVFEKSASVSHDEFLKKELECKVAAADYETAVQQLERRSLIAPGAGIITEISLHVGEACSPYQPVARLVDTRQCYFISNVEAKEAAHLKLGQQVELEIEEAPAPVKVQGQIIFLAPVVDKASGLQRVKVLFANPDGKVRPGLAGKMFIGRGDHG